MFLYKCRFGRNSCKGNFGVSSVISICLGSQFPVAEWIKTGFLKFRLACNLGDPPPPPPNAQTFFANTNIAYNYGCLFAAYSPEKDVVCMPNRSDLINEEGFVSTLSHETVHATGHKNRLARDFNGKFGSESYAFEELVADIGAGFVAGYLGYDYQFSKNNLAYIKSWLKVLKNDKKAIFKACSEAQKAFDYLLTFQEIGREAA